ncbi:MAG TPA: hypothetical protein VMV09_01510 [Candidatus Saccharimonadales bacterium]|nr:hypothetical protein [Candidatus Saccharimonadales bacterium]
MRNYLDLDNNHPDHLAAGQAAIEAIYPAAHSPAYFPDLLAQGLEPHTIHSIWVTGTADLNHFVDVVPYSMPLLLTASAGEHR